MENTINKKRSPWIDLARGIAMLAIVYGHASRDVGILSAAAYSFHVPLCVFLTGWLYEYREQSLGEHLKKTGFRLMLPYLIWSLVSMLIYTVLGTVAAGALGSETYTLGENIRYMLRGQSIGNAALWYLPFLFNLLLLAYLWFRFLHGRKTEKKAVKLTVILLPCVFSAAALAFYSAFRKRLSLDLPFSINNACFLFFFFWLGWVFKKTLKLPKEKKWLLPSVLLACGSIAWALIFNDEPEYMSFDHQDYGRNIFVFYGSALTTCLGICWFSQILGRCRLLQWFGRNSMVIFLMHKFPVLFFQMLLGGLGEKLGDFQWILFLGNTLISMCLCCWVGAVFKRFLPWAVGEPKRT